MSVKTQLNIVVGLCFDGSQSVASKFFNTRIMQVGNLQSFQRGEYFYDIACKIEINRMKLWFSTLALVLAAFQFLGRISFSLYMVHEPLIFWINSIYYGMYNRPIFDHARYEQRTTEIYFCFGVIE